jgi:hypothetical protein
VLEELDELDSVVAVLDEALAFPFSLVASEAAVVQPAASRAMAVDAPIMAVLRMTGRDAVLLPVR